MSKDKLSIDTSLTNIYARCVCKSDFNVKTIILGFPGMGLAGAIAVQHISEQLKLETIGYVEGSAIPPVAVFLDGFLRHPYRIMGREDLDIAIFIGEMAIDTEAAYHISNAAMQWAEGHGAKEIICLDGFSYLDPSDDSKVYMVAEPAIRDKVEKLNIPPLKSGYIRGFAGAILNKCMVSNIDGFAFLVGTRPDLPDPGAAAALIKTVNTHKGINVNVDLLMEQSDSIKRKLQELATQTQEIAAAPKEAARKRSIYI